MTQETPICLQWRESTPESLCVFLVPIWRLQVFFSQKSKHHIEDVSRSKTPHKVVPQFVSSFGEHNSNNTAVNGG